MDDQTDGRRPHRRRGAYSLWVVLVVLAAGLGWGGATVLSSEAEPAPVDLFTTVQVESGEVSSSIALNVEAAWTSVNVGANLRSGVVTTIDLLVGDAASQGSALYSVDLRPVFVGIGTVPAFRDIGNGMRGQDVRQLQQFLHDLGWYNGDIDGAAGAATATAIADWQRFHEFEPTGVLDRGDIVFVPALPARIVLDEDVLSRGFALVGGEQAVHALSAEPTFSLSVSDVQAAQIAPGTVVEITAPDGSVLSALAGEAVPGENGTTIQLQGATEGQICSDACAGLPTGESSLLSARVVILAPVQGLVVPVAALRTSLDGTRTVVIDKEGAERPVDVVATARGLSVITGVKAGTAVRLPVSR